MKKATASSDLEAVEESGFDKDGEDEVGGGKQRAPSASIACATQAAPAFENRMAKYMRRNSTQLQAEEEMKAAAASSD
eukprot:SAG11_NODE_6327_length_1335_cov_3.942557_2_plen_77_part_01